MTILVRVTDMAVSDNMVPIKLIVDHWVSILKPGYHHVSTPGKNPNITSSSHAIALRVEAVCSLS